MKYSKQYDWLVINLKYKQCNQRNTSESIFSCEKSAEASACENASLERKQLNVSIWLAMKLK